MRRSFARQPAIRHRRSAIRRAYAVRILLALLAAVAPWIVFAATVTMNGGPVCTSGNWSEADCWNFGNGPVPVAGDDVVVGDIATIKNTNADLGVQFPSVTLQDAGGDLQIAGAIELQSGGSITDNNEVVSGAGTIDNINAGVTLDGSTTFTRAADRPEAPPAATLVPRSWSSTTPSPGPARWRLSTMQTMISSGSPPPTPIPERPPSAVPDASDSTSTARSRLAAR